MPIRIRCPRCEAQISLPENSQGNSIQCPECKHTFPVVPEAPAAPAPSVAESKDLKSSIQQGANAAVTPADEGVSASSPNTRKSVEPRQSIDSDEEDSSPRSVRRPQSSAGSSLVIVLLLAVGLGLLSLCVVCGGLGAFFWVADVQPIEMPAAMEKPDFNDVPAGGEW